MTMNMPATNSPSTANTTTTTYLATSTAAAASSSPSTSMAKSQDQHALVGPLRCPRCDSSNTKFCYYNNYSLSQPRHFCKACKRYWTRGGTLRNVPVGGGCRKNKRSVVKKHHQQQTTATSTASATVTANSDPMRPPPSSLVNTSTLPAPSDFNSLFYGLSSTSTATNSDMMNLSSFSGTAAYDDALGLGLGGLIPSSNQLSAGIGLMNTNLTDPQQPASSFFHNNDYPASCFGSQAASLLVSRLKQPKKVDDYCQSLLPCDVNLGFRRDVKVEGENNLMGNNINSEWQANFPFDNGAIDASFLYWNPVMGGAGWSDIANSSVAPLI